MTTTTNIDGRYIIHPDGCGWVAVRICNGRLVGIREQSEGGLEPVGSEVDAATAAAVVASWDADADPMACVVERLA